MSCLKERNQKGSKFTKSHRRLIKKNGVRKQKQKKERNENVPEITPTGIETIN